MGQTLSCSCTCESGGPGGQPGTFPLVTGGPLAHYFRYAYLSGKAFAGPCYRRKHDLELGADVLEHVDSGITAWSHACDLRGSGQAMNMEEEGSTLVLFHYTDRKGFLRIASSRCLDSCAGEAPFGEGVYMCEREPEAFRSKAAVLLNNHWPSVGGGGASQAGAPRRAARLLRPGASAWGPQDPRNDAVREAVLSDEACAGKADFCVPFLVCEDRAFDIWKRFVPELRGAQPGCDRWGERQWPNRDVWVVQCSDDGGEGFLGSESLPLSTARSAADFLERMATGRLAQADESGKMLRDAWMDSQRKLGPTHPETLERLDSLAEAARLGGHGDEAEVLQRKVLQGREERLGPQHADTLASADRLGLALASCGRLDEAVEMHRRALEGREAAAGPRDPDSLAYAENLAAALRACARLLGTAGEEAEALQRRAWEGRREVFGPQHPDTQASQQRLAEMLEASGRREEAAALGAGGGGGPSCAGGGLEDQRASGEGVLELIEALAPEAAVQDPLRQLSLSSRSQRPPAAREPVAVAAR